MTDSQYEPLTGAPREETIVNMRTTGGESSRKAYKVAGFTVLACLLIAGQALTAYFALSQKSQIGQLEKSNESLKKQLHRPSGGMDGEGTLAEKLPYYQNNCKTATAGSVVPGFYLPQCDENGNFLPMQCWSGTGFCWCVDNNGLQIEGSLVKGKPKCVNSVQ